MPRFFKTPSVLTWAFPGVVWKKKMREKTLFLTFDDGPIPEVTPFVLDQLQQYNAKATFFCVGDNVQRHPAIAQQVLEQGHLLANHTFHHVKAWQHSPQKYFAEVEQCQAALESIVGSAPDKKLFRPPHGQLTWGHLRKLKHKYQVVMWSSLSYDFDASLAPEESLQKTIAVSGPGSIVVMHDSLKAEKTLKYVLPRFLEYFSALGYSFKTL
ncbi:polysaccharide deacetylase family protein [Rufibacter roseus]|uniref:Polysaccharide deacetylase family protein n=1 Tax=Rufibacter roseus TaxID=1567108 RepID=A0ABW2DTA1_9BACT|nr:polysaccharide deacetylase family protein [Rufibacter roseus]